MADAGETSDDADDPGQTSTEPNDDRQPDDEPTGDRDGDDTGSTGPLARGKEAVTETVALVVDAALEAI